jgi:hypothetical protein
MLPMVPMVRPHMVVVSGAGERTRAARLLGSLESRVHDRADRPGTTPAIGAAAKAGINLGRSPRAAGTRAETGLHVAIGEDVAGANDHVDFRSLERFKRTCDFSYLAPAFWESKPVPPFSVAVPCHTASEPGP